MGSLTLLDQARAAGLSVAAVGDRLVIRGPRRAEPIACELMGRKAEVLALLVAPAEPTLEPEGELPSYPWRSAVADWPASWRQRWGELANQHQDAGLSWHKAEARAFTEVSAEHESGAEPPPLTLPPPAELSAPLKWRCLNSSCLHKTGWWMSMWDVVQCTNCKPPTFASLVVAQGTEADAPLVEAIRSHQAIESEGGTTP
jgi:hypothetical protein